MMVAPATENSIIKQFQNRATALGFDAVAITKAELPLYAGERLDHFIDQNYHASMDWLAETSARRRQPKAMWNEAETAIILAMNYASDIDPMARLEAKDCGVISVYALNRDYHQIIKGKLKTLAQWLVRQIGGDVKVFVDTAPLMEKPLAQMAGLGWQGKHTNLVSRDLGSWFFLGAILSDQTLPTDQAESDHCGSCNRCLDICPTDAFPAPYQLDANRCISYLTIEHKGHISREFRPLMGNRIYGCDDCLAVCPWNRFARMAQEARLQPRTDLLAPTLAELASLDDNGFRQFFSGSPVKRIGRDRFIRNVLIAIGNIDDEHLLPVAENLLNDEAAVVRAMAIWACNRLAPAGSWQQRAIELLRSETDIGVKAEWAEIMQ